jgi:hypothetical protein
MPKDSDLRARILVEGARGTLPEAEAHDLLSVLAGAPIMRSVPSDADTAMGKDSIYETRDAEGKVLIAGQNYLLRGEKVKVLREERGAGNMLDVYMRVFYLDGSLEERFTVVSGRYPQGIFKEVVYNSPFEPIRKE